MGGSKDEWISQHERIGDDFVAGLIDRTEAAARLRRLGITETEAADELDMLEELT